MRFSENFWLWLSWIVWTGEPTARNLLGINGAWQKPTGAFKESVVNGYGCMMKKPIHQGKRGPTLEHESLKLIHFIPEKLL